MSEFDATNRNVVNATGNSAKLIVGVDDEIDNLTMLKNVVETAGYTFISATSGLECLGLLRRIQPRLLLLDIQMPGLDGFETCHRVRSELNHGQMPIVFLTGRKSRDDVRQGIDAGGNDYIIKPFEVMTLLERLRYWTTHRPKPRPLPVQSPGTDDDTIAI